MSENCKAAPEGEGNVLSNARRALRGILLAATVAVPMVAQACCPVAEPVITASTTPTGTRTPTKQSYTPTPFVTRTRDLPRVSAPSSTPDERPCPAPDKYQLYIRALDPGTPYPRQVHQGPDAIDSLYLNGFMPFTYPGDPTNVELRGNVIYGIGDKKEGDKRDKEVLTFAGAAAVCPVNNGLNTDGCEYPYIQRDTHLKSEIAGSLDLVRVGEVAGRPKCTTVDFIDTMLINFGRMIGTHLNLGPYKD